MTSGQAAFINPYEVLGLPDGVGMTLVKQRYRQLVLAFHPDQNPGDASATRKLQLLNEAYAFLGNDAEKKKLDAFLANPQSHTAVPVTDLPTPAPTAAPRNQPPVTAPSPRQTTYSISLSYDEARSGCVKTVPLAWQARCHRCHGKVPNCPVCEGSGTQALRRDVTVKIPGGVVQGAVMRFTKQGPPEPNTGDATDLYVTLAVDTPYRHENGITISEVTVDLWDALLGKTLPVQTPQGIIGWTIPGGVQSGSRYCMKECGLHHEDHWVNIKIQLPTSLTDKQRKLIAQLK